VLAALFGLYKKENFLIDSKKSRKNKNNFPALKNDAETPKKESFFRSLLLIIELSGDCNRTLSGDGTQIDLRKLLQ
jgi:hypothetical protein